MFRKLLIANRGEIAVRIIRTCRDLGVRTVAVHSDADADALHVRLADEAFPIGAAPPTESYLRGDRILAAARRSGAEAIHPGYGFLSENADFAQVCADAGVVFVGPPPAAMRLLGDKRAAKSLARATGVPTAPGYDGADQNDELLSSEAARLRYPLLIKASAGGGGRGMRIVTAAGDFDAALDAARREALSSFGDSTVLLEKFIERARHIEFQVLADASGGVIHLGERDCSVQRRRQKVIEESPSPALEAGVRDEMGAAAVALVRAAGYVNAGTVEFMLAPTGEYYFLEVNTRLQVEHPVTEATTRLDLVREQLCLAAGAPLSLGQDDVHTRGWAIECRIYAEDPARNYLPSTGNLVLFDPPAGEGVRNDVGVETGDEVSPYYDSMLAKLIVHATDRATCIERTGAALREYRVLGVQSNLPLLAAVLDSSDFQAGVVSTEYLDTHLSGLLPSPDGAADLLIAAAGWEALRWESAPAAPHNPWRSGPLRLPQGDLEIVLTIDEERINVRARSLGGGRWLFTTPTSVRTPALSRADADQLRFEEPERTWSAAVVEHEGLIYTAIGLQTGRFERRRELNVDEVGAQGGGRASGSLQAPMPGAVASVSVEVGETVRAGQTVMILEAMKMEHSITAPHGGIVRKLHYAPGDRVTTGAVLAEIAE